VPKNIPRNTLDLFLQRNNITQISSRDFVELSRLKQLNLENNQISMIHYRTFNNLPSLRSLNLGHNQLSCIQDKTFKNQRMLEVLTLSNNNLSTIALQALKTQIPYLRRLRLHSNRLVCDCHLSWLKAWLSRQKHRGLATLTTCHEPIELRGSRLASIDKSLLRCNDFLRAKRPLCHSYSCPLRCNCDVTGFVDCREKSLEALPQNLPENTNQLRFSYNQLDSVAAFAFADFTTLKMINLNYNGIQEIDWQAFVGMEGLKSLHLQHNKITTIHQDTFQVLRSLEVLFLQNNEITCLKRNTFQGLHSLTTLSLYGNKLQSLPEGIFYPLRTLFNLYLANNPLQCDCRLRWLTKYLRRKEAVEKSDVKCYGPQSVAGLLVSRVKKRRYRSCMPINSVMRDEVDVCLAQVECPENCECEGSKVTCSGLTQIPTDLPITISVLILRLNNIEVISNNGAFQKYASLKKIDLSNNQISKIEDGAFQGAVSLTELRLNDNRLNDIRGQMFTGLSNLQNLQIRNNRLTCLGNHSFVGLRNVRHLDVFSNHISTIDEGAFSSLIKLETLNLLSNQLNCNCRLRWLPVWLQQQSVAAGNPRCSHPYIQRNIPLTDINPNDFRCPPSTSSLPSCTPKRKCPPKCSCEGSIVRCSHSNIQTISIDDIPDDVTEIYLDRNKIKEIPIKINKFERLQRLDLSENFITRLNAGTFKNLTQLTGLILAYNKIQCIELRSFSGLRSLETLSLHSNTLSSIPEGSFTDLTSLRRLDLGENPWHCDCNLRWMLSWMDRQSVDPGIARCSGPNHMTDRLIISNPSFEFRCNGPLDIDVAAKCSPCLSSPCQYDSSCSTHNTNIYQCECLPGFKGRNCEIPIDPCILRPCLNGARCHARNEHHFECACTPGFEGKLCEKNIDDCSSSPCLGEHQVCKDEIQNFTCLCAPGWGGKNCDEKLLDKCALDSPCLNNGQCTNLFDTEEPAYRCSCTSEYRGVNCTERNEPCQNHKCEHGATCLEDFSSVFGYHCICPVDYTGQYCTFFQDTKINVLQDDPCYNNDCQNGGLCQSNRGNISGYQCRCLPGYSGLHCTQLTSLQFIQNGSFVILSPVELRNGEVLFTLRMSTLQEKGIFLFMTLETIIVAAEFFSGHVKVMLVRSEDEMKSVYSPVPINDDQPHKIHIRVNMTSISFSLDDDRMITVHLLSPPPSGGLSFSSKIHLGGISQDMLDDSNRYWFYSNFTSFKGCLHGLEINNEIYDFQSISSLQGNTESITTGCEVDVVARSCSLECRHGICRNLANEKMTCECDKGFTGKLCGIRILPSMKLCPNSRAYYCVHGRCVSRNGQNDNEPFCQCESGYTGDRCEKPEQCTNIDCGPGRCVQGQNGFKCLCPRRYIGLHCQSKRCRGRKIRKHLQIDLPQSQTLQRSSNSTDSCQSIKPFTTVVCGGRCTANRFTRRYGNQSSASRTSTLRRTLCCQPFRILKKKVRFQCSNGEVTTRVIKKVRKCVCNTRCQPK